MQSLNLGNPTMNPYLMNSVGFGHTNSGQNLLTEIRPKENSTKSKARKRVLTEIRPKSSGSKEPRKKAKNLKEKRKKNIAPKSSKQQWCPSPELTMNHPLLQMFTGIMMNHLSQMPTPAFPNKTHDYRKVRTKLEQNELSLKSDNVRLHSKRLDTKKVSKKGSISFKGANKAQRKEDGMYLEQTDLNCQKAITSTQHNSNYMDTLLAAESLLSLSSSH
mmetsp:Transcript_35712/g.47115  ORF Transcript_35712/g.47115 Transcript_35712/m.47115 type:complete len:218 (-) Transcript_35712:184-837(-)